MIPDATTALDYILAQTTDLVDKLLFIGKMLEDLNMTGGLIYSPRVLLPLCPKALTVIPRTAGCRETP